MKEFYIRGHHLRNFTIVTQLGLPSISSFVEHTARRLQIQIQYDIAKRNYAEDLVGLEGTHIEPWKQQMKSIYSDFLTLPSATSTRVSILPDNICRACDRGEHCQISNTALHDDQNACRGLIHHMKNNHLPHEVDTRSLNPQIYTSLGDLRQVLSNLDVEQFRIYYPDDIA